MTKNDFVLDEILKGAAGDEIYWVERAYLVEALFKQSETIKNFSDLTAWADKNSIQISEFDLPIPRRYESKEKFKHLIGFKKTQ